MRVFIALLFGTTVELEVEGSTTVAELKRLFKMKTGRRASTLSFGFRRLDDDTKQLCDHNIQHESTVYELLIETAKMTHNRNIVFGRTRFDDVVTEDDE